MSVMRHCFSTPRSVRPLRRLGGEMHHAARQETHVRHQSSIEAKDAATMPLSSIKHRGPPTAHLPTPVALALAFPFLAPAFFFSSSSMDLVPKITVPYLSPSSWHLQS